MKKLLLILLCLPMIGLGQTKENGLTFTRNCDQHNELFGPIVVADRINLKLKNPNDKIEDFAIKFTEEYPSNDYQIIYIDHEMRRMQIKVPETEREGIKNKIKNNLNNNVLIWDEFLSEKGYSFSIFSRSGHEIFTTNDPAKGWDGKYKGKDAQAGNYVYHLGYINGVGEIVEKTDILTIIGESVPCEEGCDYYKRHELDYLVEAYSHLDVTIEQIEALKGIDKVNPLIFVDNFIKRSGKTEFTASEFANYAGYPVSQVGPFLMNLSNKGFLLYDGKIFSSNKIKTSRIESLIKEFVEQKVTEWQQKGEFEKTTDYLERVTEKNRTIKIKEFQEAAIYNIKLDFLNSLDFSNIELGDYDADNETFLLEDKQLGNLVLSVPIDEAKLFKESFSDYKFSNPKCEIIDNKLRLSYVELTIENRKWSSYYPVNYATPVEGELKTYTYSLDNTQDYAITDIDYEFASIEIDDIKSSEITKTSNISTNKLKVGSSSVNINIPSNKKVKNRYALVIGNEDYQSKQRGLSDEQNVDYAVNDATIFKKYCLSTLGVKEDNMFFLTDATSIEMNRKIKLISKIIEKLGNKAELIVYYAGHGYPDENTKFPYLIPVDVPASDLSYAVKLDDFYKDLSATGAKNITVFLDACFTGGGRESGLIASRGVKVKPREGTLSGNLVVFSASSGNQSALPYHDEGHGMFTYHLLKKLQESKGKVSMGELADYIHDQVSIQSLKTNEKEQDPEVNTSPKVEEKWKDWTF